jgi:hypothetical protein
LPATAASSCRRRPVSRRAPAAGRPGQQAPGQAFPVQAPGLGRPDLPREDTTDHEPPRRAGAAASPCSRRRPVAAAAPCGRHSHRPLRERTVMGSGGASLSERVAPPKELPTLSPRSQGAHRLGPSAPTCWFTDPQRRVDPGMSAQDRRDRTG